MKSVVVSVLIFMMSSACGWADGEKDYNAAADAAANKDFNSKVGVELSRALAGQRIVFVGFSDLECKGGITTAESFFVTRRIRLTRANFKLIRLHTMPATEARSSQAKSAA
jgi:hypothetical protein